MSDLVPTERPKRQRLLFPLILGLVIGVLAAALGAPKSANPLGAFGPAAPQAAGLPGAPVLSETPAGGLGTGAEALSPGGARPATGNTSPTASRSQPTVRGPVASGGMRGVTGRTIKLGFAWLDLSALRYLGPSFDNGDRQRHMTAILKAFRREHLLPVNGRDIEVAARSYSPATVDPATQRRACTGLVVDEKVFAVVGDSTFYPVGTECVSREFRTPLITSDAPPDSQYTRGYPYLFTMQMSLSRLLRNWVWWAHTKGFLRGRKAGLYYQSDAVTRYEVRRNVVDVLRHLGYPAPVEVATDQARGGPTDAIAVQRFKVENVKVAMLLTSKMGFLQQAEGQDFNPDYYLDNDYLSGTTNTATSTYPAAEFDGAWGMTGMHYGEWKAGIAAPAPARRCLSWYRQEFGTTVDANAREAEYAAYLKLCDDMLVLIDALRRAGRALSPASLVAALEQVRGMPMGIHADVTFSGRKHDGVDVQRTVRWHQDCRCWKAMGRFAPLWVP